MKAKIFAFLPARALGDFIIAAVVASSVREMFDEGELFVYYRDDRPYKNSIVSLMPNITGAFTSPAKGGVFPLDFLDPPGGRLVSGNDIFEQFKVKDSNLILAGSMLNETAINSVRTTTLRIPPETVNEGKTRPPAATLIVPVAAKSIPLVPNVKVKSPVVVNPGMVIVPWTFISRPVTRAVIANSPLTARAKAPVPPVTAPCPRTRA